MGRSTPRKKWNILVHEADPKVVIIGAWNVTKINGAEANRHAVALGWLETLVDSSLVVEIWHCYGLKIQA